MLRVAQFPGSAQHENIRLIHKDKNLFEVNSKNFKVVHRMKKGEQMRPVIVKSHTASVDRFHYNYTLMEVSNKTR